MEQNRTRKVITMFFGAVLIFSAGALFYVLKLDKESMNPGLLMTAGLFSLLVVGGNLTVLLTKSIQGKTKKLKA